MLVQETLVPDYPIFLNGFNPENFDKSYRGALPAREALAQSLNIPAVLLLKKMGVEPFKGELERWGFTTLRRPSSEYGLSLILGGAEVTLWDAVGAYASMGRVLGGFTYNGSQYDPHSVHPLKFKPEKSKTPGKLQVHPTIAQAGAIQWVLQDLLEVNRPDEVLESGLKPIQGISWKTGTSFGHRDAWAIGLNQSYAIGVWVGNASGEGRNGLIGARYAAPVLFDLFRRLGGQPFEPIPLSNMVGIEICRQSGYLAGPYCEDTKELMALPKTGNMGICPFHEVVIGNNSMVELVFTLPPVMAHFFDKHPSRSASNGKNMDFIYPNDLHYIALPMDENGTTCSAVFELAHRIPLASVYWYLDGRLIKTTSDPHTLPVEVPAGKHTLLVVDQFGEEENLEFEVLPN
jgi:penicillin-binding protein 1C